MIQGKFQNKHFSVLKHTYLRQIHYINIWLNPSGNPCVDLIRMPIIITHHFCIIVNPETSSVFTEARPQTHNSYKEPHGSNRPAVFNSGEFTAEKILCSIDTR